MFSSIVSPTITKISFYFHLKAIWLLLWQSLFVPSASAMWIWRGKTCVTSRKRRCWDRRWVWSRASRRTDGSWIVWQKKCCRDISVKPDLWTIRSLDRLSSTICEWNQSEQTMDISHIMSGYWRIYPNITKKWGTLTKNVSMIWKKPLKYSNSRRRYDDYCLLIID